MSTRPIPIVETNISMAWAKAFIEATKPGVIEVSPLYVSINNLQEECSIEIPAIRQVLDISLSEQGEFPVKTVATTIFPESMWNPSVSRFDLYKRYHKILPDLKKISANRYGMYFERLIAFGPEKINQLDRIIDIYNSGTHRRSALQATIFDPRTDLNAQRQRGFPCLQQIAFNPNAKTRELSITGFYAMQYLYEKAYGNYLGLYHLGKFISHELGMRLTQVNCVAGVAKMSDKSKRALQNLTRQLGELLEIQG